jgi:hypothetical protein
MLHQVFTVYDSKSSAYLQPFFMQSEPSALRAITDLVDEAGHQFNRHPEDYTLFHLGSFNDELSKFTLHESPRAMNVLLELMTPAAPF